VVTVRIEPPDWIDQGHTDKTDRGIEAIVEWVEARETPFTTSQAWRESRCWAHYNVARQTLRSLLKAGLIVHVAGGKNNPQYLRCDLVKPGA
jgi:hypothetical protein